MANILLVDDDDHLRTMLRVVLQRAGHKVHEAREGNEAVALFEQMTFDLMITDLIMPGKEGLALILELRRRSNRQMKIIAMSGGARIVDPEGYLDVAKGFGASVSLQKPFSNQQLLDAVQEALESGESMRAFPGRVLSTP